jgi:hypothetical protein
VKANPKAENNIMARTLKSERVTVSIPSDMREKLNHAFACGVVLNLSKILQDGITSALKEFDDFQEWKANVKKT